MPQRIKSISKINNVILIIALLLTTGCGTKTFTEPVTGMVFVDVPEGTFCTGTIENQCEDGVPLHPPREFDRRLPTFKTHVKGGWIGKFEVTQKEWETIMGYNPSIMQRGPNHPVNNISWDEANTFVQKLSIASSGTYRLPSEIEWEFAARSGGKPELVPGNKPLLAVAWFYENSKPDFIHPVGQLEPNGLGIHDMAGNLSEWCNDAYSETGFVRSTRGGWWFSTRPRLITVTLNRWGMNRTARGSSVGFRVFKEN